jgi:hypothetical protein
VDESKMTTLREAAQLALEALEALMNYSSPHGLSTVVLTLRKALEADNSASRPEPVAWMDREGDLYKMPEIEGWAPPHTLLYTHPPQRKPLTNEELDALAIDEDGLPNSHFEFARAIERAHGIGGRNDR